MLRRLRFDIWYLFHPPWDSGISPPELLDYIASHPAGRAVDLGCGTGTNVITLAQAGWKVTGVDFSPRAIRLAKRKIRAAGLDAEVRAGDATRMKLNPGCCDLALDIGCFHGVADKPAYLHGLKNLLRPDGNWLMYGFFKTALEEPGPGLTQADLDLIHAHNLRQVSRKDGSERGGRPSAWFIFAPAQTARNPSAAGTNPP